MDRSHAFTQPSSPSSLASADVTYKRAIENTLRVDASSVLGRHGESSQAGALADGNHADAKEFASDMVRILLDLSNDPMTTPGCMKTALEEFPQTKSGKRSGAESWSPEQAMVDTQTAAHDSYEEWLASPSGSKSAIEDEILGLFIERTSLILLESFASELPYSDACLFSCF